MILQIEDLSFIHIHPPKWLVSETDGDDDAYTYIRTSRHTHTYR